MRWGEKFMYNTLVVNLFYNHAKYIYLIFISFYLSLLLSPPHAAAPDPIHDGRHTCWDGKYETHNNTVRVVRKKWQKKKRKKKKGENTDSFCYLVLYISTRRTYKI